LQKQYLSVLFYQNTFLFGRYFFLVSALPLGSSLKEQLAFPWLLCTSVLLKHKQAFNPQFFYQAHSQLEKYRNSQIKLYSSSGFLSDFKELFVYRPFFCVPFSFHRDRYVITSYCGLLLNRLIFRKKYPKEFGAGSQCALHNALTVSCYAHNNAM